MRTGILLPKSSTHPLLGHDFFGGVKAAFREEKEEPEFFTGNIGFGTDRNLIYAEAEKLWLEKQVDVLVIFADFPNVEVLFPLSVSLNKLLIVVNSGAKYPVTWEAPKTVLFLNLQEWVNAALTGEMAAVEGPKKGIFVTSFYDGGYAASHSMSEAFFSKGGEILYNFVGKHLLKEFDTTPLKEFLKTTEEPVSVLSLYSGELTAAFLQQLQDEKLQVWVNPYFLFELVHKENSGFQSAVQGYVSWWPAIAEQENQKFLEHFKQQTGRDANAIGLLGWETASLLRQLIAAEPKPAGADSIITLLKGSCLTSPRGEVQLDPETHHFFGPSYIVKLQDGLFQLNKSEKVLSETYKNQMAAMPDPPQTGWVNTYLCS